MKVKSKEMLAALELPVRVAGKRYSHHLIGLHSNGSRLKISADTADESISTSIDCEGPMPAVLVNAKMLATVAGFGRDFELEHEGASLIYVADKKIRIPIADGEMTKLVNQGKGYGVSTSLIATGIRAVRDFMYPDDARPGLCCVHINCGPTSVMCEAGNGHSIAVFKTAAVGVDLDFCIPANFVPICALLMGESTLTVGETMATLSGDSEYTFKLQEGSFTKHGIMDIEYKPVGILSSEWRDAFESIQAIRDNQDYLHCEITFGEKEARIRTIVGNYDQTILGKFTPGVARVNSHSMLNALKAFDGDIELSCEDFSSPRPLKFTSGDLSVVMTQLR